MAGGDARSVLRSGRAVLAARLDGLGGEQCTSYERGLSHLLDDYFRLRFSELQAEHDRIAIVAVGGYGRQELSPASDVDVLILCSRTIPSRAIDIAQALLLPLWDEGLTLGHGFRTVADCMKLAACDHRVLASLLDARLVVGNESLFRELVARLDEKVLPKRTAPFLAWLDAEHERRLATYGDGAILLEPELKDGVGGLRDYHRILWLARLRSSAGSVEEIMSGAGFSPADAALLHQAVNFLHEVRNQLHRLSRRKNDRLSIELQPEIAACLGFKDTARLLAVEVFLGNLHRCMADIKGLSAAFRGTPGAALHPAMPCPEMDGGVVIKGGAVHLCLPDEVAAWPRLVLDAFVRAASEGEDNAPRMDWNTRRRMGSAIADAAMVLEGADIGSSLLSILVSGRAFVLLEQMDAIGLLPALFAEYGAARDRVQFDGFHTYPVGMHTLAVVRQLESLSGGGPQPFADIWRHMEDRRALMLAALFHDLGKGESDATHHAERGASIAERVLAEWGVDEDVAADVVFLVREHLLLMRTAQRRDLNDESVVAQVAGIVGDERRLVLLLLLSYADASATGPKAWNHWMATLLDELRGKTANMLRDGVLGSVEAALRLRATREDVRRLLVAGGREHGVSPVLSDGVVEEYLQAMPARYLLGMDARRIVRHLGLVRQLHLYMEEARRRLEPVRAERSAVVVEGVPANEGKDGGTWELTVVARDQQGVFATVTGVLALHGINVYGAEAFVWGDGTVLDVFFVSAPPDPLYAAEFWGKVRSSIAFAMTGKLAIDFHLEEARRKQVVPDVLLEAVRQPQQVRVDNSLSDFYTVIDVFAPDRPVLLYDIARALQLLQLDVFFAKVSTLGNRTADTFSVRTLDGSKVNDEEHLAAIHAALLHAASPR